MEEMKLAKIEVWPIEKLQNWEQNPRSITKINYERLKKQVVKYGQYKPLVITENGIVIGGNMRLRVYRDLGYSKAIVAINDAKTDAEMFEIAMSDNDAAGDTEAQQLAELMATIDGIDLELLHAQLKPSLPLKQIMEMFGPNETSEDEAPALSEEEPISKTGVVYQLGKHRVLCGDSVGDITALMGDQKADMVFTDPPYNIGYEGGMNESGQNDRDKIANDKMSKSDFRLFLDAINKQIMDYCKGPIYICMSSSELDQLKPSFEAAGGHWQGFIVWVKNHFTLGRSDYQHIYEPILYGWPKSVVNHYFLGMRNHTDVWEDLETVNTTFDGVNTSIKFQGFEVLIEGKVEGRVSKKRQKTDIWRYDKPVRSEEHPTMKPISLCGEAIRNSCPDEGIVLDLFLGSGSTLIAAEQLGRICYGCELDPKYVDVIRKRYWKFINNGNEEGWQDGTINRT